ncbi:MAG: ATP-binding protein [Planctomycetota bacterium]|jgi:nicotinamide riboside kinase|nr:ATP-binding protein [Planctomycetota bacterium]
MSSNQANSQPNPTRVYLVGAHATGKTTLARWIRDSYGLPMISEVARGVLAEMEAQLDALRTNVDLVNHYQAQVFERQMEAEEDQQGPYVSDRAFCNLAYAAHHSRIMGEVAGDPRLLDYMDRVRGGIVFFLRPHKELIVPDGVRAGLEWEDVVRIDGMVKFMLEMFSIPYIPVESLSMQERTRLLERVLGLAGLEPSVPQGRYLRGANPLVSRQVRAARATPGEQPTGIVGSLRGAGEVDGLGADQAQSAVRGESATR